jgi:hypothetical protein
MNNNNDDNEDNEEDDPNSFLSKLSGNWILLWTTQELPQQPQQQMKFVNRIRRWINPLENQSYSNNLLRTSMTAGTPSSNSSTETTTKGRSNPVLPRAIQDRLESIGIIDTKTSENENPEQQQQPQPPPLIRSSQSIDISKKQVKNVVTIRLTPPTWLSSSLTNLLLATLTVSIQFQPDPIEIRKINVKFNSCRIRLQKQQQQSSQLSSSSSTTTSKTTLLDWDLPLGIIGPTGWLNTTYIDDNIRITRGHKGSVFVLARPATVRTTTAPTTTTTTTLSN